jgi:enoyl-CoA hydratase/carnithine racemase
MTDSPAAPDQPVVLVDDAARVRTITFNRPEAANAFNERLYHAVAGALRDAAGDDAVSVVVLTGAGRTFCGGTDLHEMAGAVPDPASGDDPRGAEASGPGPGPDSSRGFTAFVAAISTFPKPLLAAVNGAGVGLGLTMLPHCDVVLVSERARLLAPFTAMGVAPEAASSYLLPRRMGKQRAARYLFASEWISAEAAVDSGLALKVCDADQLLPETLELAKHIAGKSLPSLMATKRLLLESEREGIVAAGEREGAAFAELLRLPNARDGVLGQLVTEATHP